MVPYDYSFKQFMEQSGPDSQLTSLTDEWGLSKACLMGQWAIYASGFMDLLDESSIFVVGFDLLLKVKQ